MIFVYASLPSIFVMDTNLLKAESLQNICLLYWNNESHWNRCGCMESHWLTSVPLVPFCPGWPFLPFWPLMKREIMLKVKLNILLFHSANNVQYHFTTCRKLPNKGMYYCITFRLVIDLFTSWIFLSDRGVFANFLILSQTCNCCCNLLKSVK